MKLRFAPLALLPLTLAGADGGHDLVVYGGTSAGVVAAVQMAREGKSAIVVEPSQHVGGLTSGGLGATDTGNKAVIGGVSREFYQRLQKHYSDEGAWTRQRRSEFKGRGYRPDADAIWQFEPHVAEKIYREMLAEAGVEVVYGERIDRTEGGAGVVKKGTEIVSITTESGREFAGKRFVDATYEGDLMALAGVSYHVGREPNSQYGETLNGVQTRRATKHQFMDGIDPYVKKGDPASGILPGIQGEGPGEEGSGDHRVQAYCFRMCLTDDPGNRVPFPKPEGYDPMRYELLLRYIEGGWRTIWGNHQAMPNRKTDTNNHGGFSTDNIGMNYDYPEGSYRRRAEIVEEHETYQKGFFWFLCNDPRVPKSLQDDINKWGLAKDEFTDNGNWPHQLYIREARRMVSDYVNTEHDCFRKVDTPEPVGMGSYNMDSHNVQRYINGKGHVKNEGDIQVSPGGPYKISYRAIRPRRDECTNLLVPCCVSSSHIAYGSIRMEPVFMILGHSAAAAASMSIDLGVPVQDVPYDGLRAKLLGQGQVLDYEGKTRAVGTVLIRSEELPGIVVDDDAAELVGFRIESSSTKPYIDRGYRHDGDSAEGLQGARFVPDLPRPGAYEVRIAYPAHENRAKQVRVNVITGREIERFTIDQTKTPAIDGVWHSLGRLMLAGGKATAVEVTNEGADGYVVVDAVQFLPVEE